MFFFYKNLFKNSLRENKLILFISLTSGGLLLLGKLLPWFFFASIELAAYSAVYKRFHVVDIPLDSWLAHFIVFLGVDLGYYCM